MVIWAASYRQEAMELTPLHMGHCIVMGEALLVAVVSQVASRIGTYSHFIKSCQARPAACRTCSCPTSETLKQRARQRGAATCYTWCHTTPKKYKDLVRRQIWRDCGSSLFYGRSQENNPLRVLINIPWHHSSLGDSIFHHKGSRRTSAWERILAELGTFQGPGLRGPFGLCMVSGILFMEATRPSVLLSSLEYKKVSCLPCASLGETTEPFCFHISLWANREFLLLFCSLLVFPACVAFSLASLCLEPLPASFSASLTAWGDILWCWDPLSVLFFRAPWLLPGLVLSTVASISLSCGCRLISRFPPLLFLLPWSKLSLLGESFKPLRGPCWRCVCCRVEDDGFPAWVDFTEFVDCGLVRVTDVLFLPGVTFCAWISDFWGV